MDKDSKTGVSEEIKSEVKKSDPKNHEGDKKRTLKSKLGDFKGEYKKIAWPTRQELLRETFAVIITCLVVGAVITSFDTVFYNGYKLLTGLFI